MSRLQQQNPNNYGSAGAIQADFENIIRYLAASERGARSLPEMMQSIFNEAGELAIGIQFQFSSNGLQFRLSDKNSWQTLASADALRGAPGRDIGTVTLPIITQRVDVTAVAGQRAFPYVHNAADYLFLYINGLLLGPSDYTSDPTNNVITLTIGAALNDVISIYKVRGDAGIAVQRFDTTVTGATQAVFPVQFPSNSFQEQVFLNGILLAPTTDYIKSDATNTITLTTAGVLNDVLSVVIVSEQNSATVAGFLLEGTYTDAKTGLIPYSKLSIADSDIQASKVAGLVEHISTAAKITMGATTPLNPVSRDLWLDTSLNPATLKVYDGSQFLATQPENYLPSIKTTDTNNIVQINATGTGFVYKPLDFSSLIRRVEAGIPGGIATLNSNGLLEESQRPLVRVTDTIHLHQKGTISNGNLTVRQLFGEKFRIIGLTCKTTSGSCDIQIGIDSVALGSVHSTAAASNDQVFSTVIEVDAVTVSKTLDIIVSSVSTATDLFVTLVIERLN